MRGIQNERLWHLEPMIVLEHIDSLNETGPGDVFKFAQQGAVDLNTRGSLNWMSRCLGEPSVPQDEQGKKLILTPKSRNTGVYRLGLTSRVHTMVCVVCKTFHICSAIFYVG